MLFQPQSQKGPFCWPEWPKIQLFGSKTLENDVWESFWDFLDFDPGKFSDSFSPFLERHSLKKASTPVLDCVQL